MSLGALKYIVLFTVFKLGTFGAIVDDSRDEEHPQGIVTDNSSKNGWRLVIYPQTLPNINLLVKRVDDTLNLTCKIEPVEIDKYNNININETIDEDQHGHPAQHTFRISWYLPFGLENSKNRVYNYESRNSLQLIVEKLREADGGEYKCQTESLSQAFTSNRFVHEASVNIRVKPKRGTCLDPMFSCASGECIARRYLCDGKKDCKSEDDESQQQCGPWNPCEGKLQCEDGRCISSSWCCDRSIDRNCTVRSIPKCCLQLQSIQVNLDVSQYSPQPQHYNDMGFLQTTIYTVIGCAMAFMFIITIMVIAICRVHLKRTALARYPHLAHSGANQRHDSWGNIFLHPSGLWNAPSAASGLLVTYNINNGVQFMGSRPLHPPPYSEVMRVPPREGPPPPYDSRENVSTIAGCIGPSSTRTESPSPAAICATPQVDVEGNVGSSSSSSRLDYSRNDQINEPTTLEPLLLQQNDNDNNNGDINGNNTVAVRVEPNRNQEEN